MSEREDANGNSLPQRRLFYRVLPKVGKDIIKGEAILCASKPLRALPRMIHRLRDRRHSSKW
jgi:hypothetical protein